MNHIRSGIIFKIVLGIAMAISLSIPSGCMMFVAKQVYKAVKPSLEKDHSDREKQSE